MSIMAHLDLRMRIGVCLPLLRFYVNCKSVGDRMLMDRDSSLDLALLASKLCLGRSFGGG
jgi:hypothetical protein